VIKNKVKTRLRKLIGILQQLHFRCSRSFSGVFGSDGLQPATERASFFAPVAAGSVATLEIGPLHTPICKRPACNVEYIDVFSTEQLRKMYSDDPNVPVDDIVEVDHVWTNENYRELIGKTVDTIVSSHNIEHTPCLLQFLKNLEECLNPAGAVYLAIPDKRYCFDYFKSESSLEEVILAFRERRTRPGISALLRQQLLVTHNNGWKHWLGDHGSPACFTTNVPACGWVEKIDQEIDRYTNTKHYIDTHAWIFTPFSFTRLISGLGILGYISLRVEVVHDTAFGSHEFYAILRKP
jgi:hypothetical protein